MSDELEELTRETDQDTEGIKKLRRMFKEIKQERDTLREQVSAQTTDLMIANAGLSQLPELQRTALKSVMETQTKAGTEMNAEEVRKIATSLNFVQEQQGQQAPGQQAQTPNQGQAPNQMPNQGPNQGPNHPASMPGQQQMPNQVPNQVPNQMVPQPGQMPQQAPNQMVPQPGQMQPQMPGQPYLPPHMQGQGQQLLNTSAQAMMGAEAANQHAVTNGQGQTLAQALDAAKHQGRDAVRNVLRTRGGEANLAHDWDT